MRQTNELTKNLRESLITTCAKTYFKHVDTNGGSCARGFVDNLLASVREKAALDITKDDLVNEFWRIKKRRKDEQEGNENESRERHMVADDAAGNKLSPEELTKRCQCLNRFTLVKSLDSATESLAYLHETK